MSGSNAICVATVLLATGILEMTEPETHLVLEAPAAWWRRTRPVAMAKSSACVSVTFRRLRIGLDARVEVAGIGTLVVDTAYGGDSFVIADAAALGFGLDGGRGARSGGDRGCGSPRRRTSSLGFAIRRTRTGAISRSARLLRRWRARDGVAVSRNAVAIRPGKIDRSPCGTGCSARLAVLFARGVLRVGEAMIGRSIIDFRFDCRIEAEARVGDLAAIVPSIEGQAWITVCISTCWTRAILGRAGIGCRIPGRIWRRALGG